MRIVQRRSDGRFYAGTGLWCDQVEDARRFQSAMQALQQCEELHDLSDEIVFSTVPEVGELHLVVR